MTSARPVSQQERAVIAKLLESQAEYQSLLVSLDALHVSEMNDEGMGSLSLHPRPCMPSARSMGTRIALGEATDADGVLLSIALNVDKQGELYELDVWRVDFSPLLQLPEPSAIRIIVQGGDRQR
jgi:hypothetical protein